MGGRVGDYSDGRGFRAPTLLTLALFVSGEWLGEADEVMPRSRDGKEVNGLQVHSR
jgi:hypothetical protein